MSSAAKSNHLLLLVRNGRELSFRQQLMLSAQLSLPAMIAQLSAIVMQYIDASMVGSLGANPSASIGLVATTTWLFSGLCAAFASGFSVQVAHSIGANKMEKARIILRQSVTSIIITGAVLALIGTSISPFLPIWLGGSPSICADSSTYFFIYSLALPILQLNLLAAGMLRCSGNMLVPSLMGVAMCLLDVVFNYFLIFPTREVQMLWTSLTVPGAGLGVTGAALGTAAAQVVTTSFLLWYLWNRSHELKQKGEGGRFIPTLSTLKKAVRISFPMGLEHVVICGAQIMTTVIVAPLGVFAIAANSLAVIAESICYMPGYGIADAATTLVGQSMGARRKELTWRFSLITVYMGIAVMGVMGLIMYVFAPQIIGIMSPVEEIRTLGTSILRIEAFAEPMFAASIVAYGVFVGAAHTFIPCMMNFVSIWAVRLTLAFVLAPTMGLNGVWLAMCIELCFRGIIFLFWLHRKKWMKHSS